MSVSCLTIFPNIIYSPSHQFPLFLCLVNGAVATVPLPNNLAAGNYMIRHEIIALHLATTIGKAEFYPSCAQIKVGGSQMGAPNPDECVTFPGGYSDDDPGLYDRQVFDPSAVYVFPGPPVASFVNHNTGGNSSSKATTTSSTTASVPPVHSSQASGQSCEVAKRSTVGVSQRRLISRIIGRFAFEESRH